MTGGAAQRSQLPSARHRPVAKVAVQRPAPTFQMPGLFHRPGRSAPEPCAIISRLSHSSSTTAMRRSNLLLFILPALLLSACAHRYQVQGLVLDVNRNDRTMIISHRAIPGYMDAMAMPFRVRTAPELDSVKRGDQVEFQLVVKGANLARGKGASRNERRSGQCPARRSAAASSNSCRETGIGHAGAGFSVNQPICAPRSSVRFCRSNHRGEFHLHALPAPRSLSAIVGQFRASAEAIPRANGTGSCSSIRYAGLSARHHGCTGRLCEAVGRARRLAFSYWRPSGHPASREPIGSGLLA